MKKYRIGIDVGGTFTHAVAIEAEHLVLAGKTKVPTTHNAANGVGEGVVRSLQLLMEETGITPENVVFVAHSTTQATNSLLEGDVEKVGILSIGSGRQGALTRRAARLGKIPLSPGRYLETFAHHIDPADPGYQSGIDRFLNDLRKRAIRVVVVSGAFSVEDPAQENAVAEFVRAEGFLATSTHEVSQLYGVRVRTRTTAINASILPKMMEVADVTAREIRKLGIAAPFMIMRSDGGVMSIEEMRRKPILTLLSGPAAGIAAALRYLRITDGVFLEVGGTSTDISVIRNGRAITRSATIGGNKTFLRTLDCRTLGVGGGSIPRVKGSEVVAVGPRSAHIAGVKYAAFETARLGATGVSSLQPCFVQPKEGDPSDYLVFTSPVSPSGAGAERVGFTPTCASNALGLVPPGDAARASSGFPAGWQEKLASPQWGGLEAFSEKILEACSNAIGATVLQLLKEYKLEPSWVTLVGGGGGASAIVPHLAKSLGMKYEIARDAEVISAIGVALGMIRETVEKSLVNPTREDIHQIRTAAREKVLSQGADPASIEVFLEVDTKRNLVRAEAQGSMEFQRSSLPVSANSPAAAGTDDAVLEIAQQALGLTRKPRLVERARSESLQVARVSSEESRIFGLWKTTRQSALVFDSRGVVRLRLGECALLNSRAETLVSDLNTHLETHTVYGDGGVTYPYIHALLGDRIIDLSKLQSPDHFAGVLEMEAKEVPGTQPAVLLFSHHGSEE